MKRLKKLLLILFFLLILGGCKKNEAVIDNNIDNAEEKFVLEKNDENKDFIYLENYRELKLVDGSTYLLQNAVINIKSEDVLNVNLELSSFVKKSFKDMVIDGNVLKQGNIVGYTNSNTSKYVSVIQKYYPYINGVMGEEKTNVYVVSKETGRIVSKEEILKDYGYSEDSFFEKLENKLDSEDVLYTMMNIKNNGYDLYINNESRLVAIYYEVSEDESIRKELILD